MANYVNSKISSMIDQALKDHDAGLHNDAMTGFKSVLKIDPTNIVSLYMLGALHSEREQYQTALQYLNKAIAGNHKFAQSYQARSVIYSKLGQYKLAFADTKTALSLDPHMEEARKNYDTLEMLATNTTPTIEIPNAH